MRLLQLDMPIEHLEENWLCWRETLDKHRANVNLGKHWNSHSLLIQSSALALCLLKA